MTNFYQHNNWDLDQTCAFGYKNTYLFFSNFNDFYSYALYGFNSYADQNTNEDQTTYRYKWRHSVQFGYSFCKYAHGTVADVHQNVVNTTTDYA